MAACGMAALQKGQLDKSQNPQRLQNLASMRFSVWQFEQKCLFITVNGVNISDF
jgi:hypothetical protein